MRRHMPGLHSKQQDLEGNLDGLFLVRVERAAYRWHRQKPFLALQFVVLEPKSFESRSFSGQLYCTERALWKLTWFLTDFGYDTELLNRDQVDEKAVLKQQLREVGWSKAVELVKVARRDGEDFDRATWLHKARELPKEGFKVEVERHLTGKATEPWEIIYFKLYKSQLAVVEKAIETAALMLGTDRSRGYCLEMICADFLAGANLQENQP
jgi:hypothetical protein